MHQHQSGQMVHQQGLVCGMARLDLFSYAMCSMHKACTTPFDDVLPHPWPPVMVVEL